MTIGQAIKDGRRIRRLTQIELALKANITQTYLSQIEADLKSQSKHVLNKISVALEIPIPIIMWLSLTENDISQDKKEIFEKLKPSIDSLITLLL